MALVPYWKWRYGWDTSAPEEGQQNVLAGLQGRYRQVDYLLENETHYILVIHGTFDAPNPNNTPPKWYQLDPDNPENFCTILQLNIDFLQEEMGLGSKKGKESSLGGGADPTAAADAASSYSVWRDLPAEIPQDLKDVDPEYPLWAPFAWDAENADASRVKAGKRLGRLMHFIATKDPSARVHVIAHSHGGNVLLKAVEKYMQELSQQSQDEWDPAIKQSFWSSYKNQWKQVKKWRKMHHVGVWRRLFPLLVVRRTVTGDVTRGLERYPFAYYKWFDDFLGLGHIRQQIYLRHRKASSPVTNALGNLTFLGTPFLVRRFSTSGIFALMFAIFVKALVAAVLLWLYVGGIYLAVTEGKAWYSGLGLRSLVFLAIFLMALGFMAWSSIGRMLLEHGNIYHHTRYNWTAAMRCLVAHAGLLDEAAMGLSAEPVVEGLLVPKIRSIMLAGRFQSWPALPGDKFNAVQWMVYILRVLISLWINALGLIPLIQTIIGNALGPVFGNALKAMVMEMTLGLTDQDYSYGRIYVEHVLRLPVAEVQHWNVQQLIAAHQQKNSKFSLRLKNGEHLSADEIVEKQMKARDEASRISQRSFREQARETHETLTNGEEAQQQPDAQTREESQQLLGNTACKSETLRHRNPPAPDSDSRNGTAAASEAASASLQKTGSKADANPLMDYSFLWNKELLEKEASKSQLYEALQDKLDTLWHNPDLTETQFREEVKGICVMFEKRIAEVGGGVEFSHSIYFKNATIIHALAYFMVNRELPFWANEVTGVSKDVKIHVGE